MIVDNPEKQVLVRDNETGKEFFITRQAFEGAKKSPTYSLWEKVGLQKPSDVLNTWYVNDDERSGAIRNSKPYFPFSDTGHYFRITNRIDNTFIEGILGHTSLSTEFFSELDLNYTYFNDYLQRKKVHFTFDRIVLYRVTDIVMDNPLRLILKRIENLPVFKPSTAFMIMPFGHQLLNDFYENNIRRFLKTKFDIDVYRADNFTDNDVIIETIYRSIEQSEFVIAETTHNNKNVFYELGYAVAKEREVITIQNKDEQSIFFDRAHVRSIFYSFDQINKFKEDLIGTITTIRNRT